MSKENVEAFKRGLEAETAATSTRCWTSSTPRSSGTRRCTPAHTRRASGVETATPLAFVTEIRNGKTISIRAYLDREEALEAARPREPPPSTDAPPAGGDGGGSG